MKILDWAKDLMNKLAFWRRTTPAIVALGLAGTLMVAGVIGAPTGVKAEVLREFDDNAIIFGGFADAAELCGKIANGDDKHDDLQSIFAAGGITVGNCMSLMGNAKDGTIFRDGHVEVDGDTVAKFAKTMGRQDFGDSQPYPIGDKTYFVGTPEERWADDRPHLPVLVWFDDKGTAKLIVMKPCGNPVPFFEKVPSGAECKDLIKEPVKDKKNTYTFTTEATKFGLAEFLKFEYFIDDEDEPFATTESADTPVEKTFTKDATVHVKITISLPGDKTDVIVSDACVEEVKVEKEKPPEEKPKPPVQVLSVKKVTPPPAPAALPVTGPAGLAGLFAGVSAAGAVGHHLYRSYRGRKQQ